MYLSLVIYTLIFGVSFSVAASIGNFPNSKTHLFPLRKVRCNRRGFDIASGQDRTIFSEHTGSAYLDNDVTIYTINATFGTPGQPITIEIDTGSSDVWITSTNSSFCADPDNYCDYGLFNPQKSSSIQYLNKPFNITYQDLSFGRGEWISDSITFAGFTLEDYTIGLDYFGDNSMGYMGLGFPAGESTNFNNKPSYTYPNLLVSLKEDGLINRAAFSLYLDSIDDTVGSLLFGGIDNAKLDGDLFTLPIIPSASNPSSGYVDYTIQLNGMTMGSTPLITQAQYCLVDSGQSFAAFPPSAFSAAVEFFNATNSDPDYAGYYTLSCDFDNSDEVFTFSFPGSNSLKVPASNFLLPIEDGTNNCYLGIRSSEQDNITVFGDPILRSAYVVFDQEAYQISFAQAKLNVTENEVVEIPELIKPVTPTATLSPVTGPTCKR
ncbi:Yps3p [Sugiyamaella lignohabitans]|uniref:Yps3p n=1 Tax=Sugiyamaella lignohabitans TaxID=796027 RepID=A0A167FGW5_9ASCO|nr:Yps3p [Sugiyamaella lignohabitans]ANB15284.1 Yps3p [Sugiyamaella lignohabitans]